MLDEATVEAEFNKLDPDRVHGQSKYPGMTYEAGLDAAFRWVLEWSDESPIEEY